MAEIKEGALWFKLTFYLVLGESKGYGLIKYVSSDAAAQARHLLDGRTVTCPNNPHAPVYSLDCDWLNSAHITFRSLHSKALLVNSLPPNYRDMGDFRRIFSVVKTPPYCQVRKTRTRCINSQPLFDKLLIMNVESSYFDLLPHLYLYYWVSGEIVCWVIWHYSTSCSLKYLPLLYLSIVENGLQTHIMCLGFPVGFSVV